jgi:hypothetical protein
VTARLGSLPQWRSGVVLREDGDRSMLVTPSGSAYELNPTARAIWELCDGYTTVEELATAISEVFLIDPPGARREVAATIRMLRDADLVTGPTD